MRRRYPKSLTLLWLIDRPIKPLEWDVPAAARLLLLVLFEIEIVGETVFWPDVGCHALAGGSNVAEQVRRRHKCG